MNTKNINRIIRGLTLSLCMGFIFTHTTVYAAGPLGGPAGGPTPSNDLMRAPMLGAPGGGGDAGDAKSLGAHCYCKASCVNLQGQTTASMVVKDYGTRPGAPYYPPYNMQWKVNECSTFCTNAAASDVHSQALATAACGMNCPNNSKVIAFSAIGNDSYNSDAPLGILVNTPAVYKTNHICPAGSDWNGSYCNQKSSSCVMPAGTPLITLPNNWGTIVNNVLWLNVGPGTTSQTLVTPAQCHF